MATFFNVGATDRRLRVTAGLVLGTAAFVARGHSNVAWTLGILGASLVLSGICAI
jgi:DUF2892 family protein